MSEVYLLGIETTTSTCSVAISSNEEILVEQVLNVPNAHSTHLQEMIDVALSLSGINREQLSAIVVSKGPGSYTGLRIGVSTAKGLCVALDIPLIAVDTLDSMVNELPFKDSDALYLPMIDARRMEVYTKVLSSSLELLQETHAKVVDEDSFLEYQDKHLVIVGKGGLKCKEVLGGENISYAGNVVPTAKGILTLGYQRYLNEEFEDVAYFAPFYLKDFIAIKPKKLV